MKKILVLFLFVGIALVAVITCPQKDAHKDALMKLVNVALDTELYDKAKTEEEMGFAMLGSVIGSGIAEIILDKKLLVDNYFVCSAGRIIFDGEEKIVSIGFLNHVFTMSEEQLKEELKNSL